MENEIFWKAVKNGDARFNGAFVYAVSSTKIYCKPSCASKLPKRENVRFFRAFAAAEKHGFRACRRCRPKDEKPDARTQTALRACEILESAEQITLADLSARLDLSPAHLQKLFKEIIGVSPKKFADSRRLEKFKNELKTGSNVADAMYEAGFGSSSRLYERVSEKLGMTPAVYKKGGRGLKIGYAVVETEFGKLLAAKTEKGICSVGFGETKEILEESLKKEFPYAEIDENLENLKASVEAILENLAGAKKHADLPLDVRATAFQMRVWQELRKIPYGATASYGEIAEKIGSKKSVRAVARACASNPVALVVPCHRVVRSDGNLSGYRWGAERKKAILEKERKNQEKI